MKGANVAQWYRRRTVPAALLLAEYLADAVHLALHDGRVARELAQRALLDPLRQALEDVAVPLDGALRAAVVLQPLLEARPGGRDGLVVPWGPVVERLALAVLVPKIL